ncbi:MAG: VOC family protein [Actinomycetota bacterium]
MALVRELDHFNLRTTRLAETSRFFQDVLGLEDRPDDRPPFGFPGAWLWVGDRPLVHLIEVDTDQGPPRGALDHVAFATDDFDGLITRLTDRGIKHRTADQPATGLRQVFFREPNGVQIEVTCPAG